MQPNRELKQKLRECADLLSKVAEEGIEHSSEKAAQSPKKVINLSALRSLYGNK